MWVVFPYSPIRVRISIFLWSADGQCKHQTAHTGYGNVIVCSSHTKPPHIDVTACVLQKPHPFFYTMKAVWTHQVLFKCLFVVIWAVLDYPVWTQPLQRGTGLQWVTSAQPMRTSQLPKDTSSGMKSCLDIVFRKLNHVHGDHWWCCKSYRRVCTSAAEVGE